MLVGNTLSFNIESIQDGTRLTLKVSAKHDPLHIHLEDYVYKSTKSIFLNFVGDVLPSNVYVYSPMSINVDSLVITDLGLCDSFPKYTPSKFTLYGSDRLMSTSIGLIQFDEIYVNSVSDLLLEDAKVKLLNLYNVNGLWIRSATVKLLISNNCKIKTIFSPTYNSSDAIVIGKNIIFLDKDVYFDMDSIRIDGYIEKKFSTSNLKTELSNLLIGYLI